MRKIVECSAFVVLLTVVIMIAGCGSRNVKKAQDYIDGGMYEDAVKLLQMEIQDSPKNVEAHYLLGVAYLFMGLDSVANESFTRVILLDTKYREKIGEGYYKVGLKALEEGDLRKAVHCFQGAKEKDTTIGSKIAKLFFDKGSEIANTTDKADEAILYMQLSAEFDPTYREKLESFCFETAKHSFEKGLLGAAIQFGECSIAAGPQHIKEVAIMLYNIGIQCAKKGEEEKFHQAFEKAIKLYPDYRKEGEEFLYYLAEYYYFTGGYEAKKLYTELEEKFRETDLGKKAKMRLDNWITGTKVFTIEPTEPSFSSWDKYGPGSNPCRAGGYELWARSTGYNKYGFDNQVRQPIKELQISACLSSEFSPLAPDPNDVTYSSDVTLVVNDVEIDTKRVIPDNGYGEVYSWKVTSPELLKRIALRYGSNYISFQVKKNAEYRNGMVIYSRVPIKIEIVY